MDNIKDKIQKIVRAAINEVLNEALTYKMQSTDELMEYAWIKPNVSNLKLDIFVDDGFAYQRGRHPLILFARNGYNKSCDTFIPITICSEPRIIDQDMDIFVNFEDIYAIQDFIELNYHLLVQLADEKISLNDFVTNLNTNYSQVVVAESFLLTEMATLRSQDSGLPVDIWLDEGSTYNGHAPRIKFRANNDQRTTREFSSMIISDSPTIENMERTILRKKEIDKIKKFVLENKNLLLALCNGSIDYRTDFLPNMHKIKD